MNAPGSARTRPALARFDNHPRRGFALGLAAYGLWGVLPIYFEALRAVPPVDIVAHRVLWSLPFLAILVVLALAMLARTYGRVGGMDRSSVSTSRRTNNSHVNAFCSAGCEGGMVCQAR